MNESRGRLPAVPWNVGATVWGLIVGLALAVLVVPALVLPFDPNLDSLAAVMVAQALLGLTLAAVAFAIASDWGNRPAPGAARSLGLRRFAPGDLGVAALTLLAYYVFAAVFATVVLQPEQEDIGRELGLDEGVVGAILARVLIAGLAPITEEIFFRGFVFGGLRARLPLWLAALISGVLFGLVHAPTGITTLPLLSALGVALAWLYERTGSLGPPMIAHAVNNALALQVAT